MYACLQNDKVPIIMIESAGEGGGEGEPLLLVNVNPSLHSSHKPLHIIYAHHPRYDCTSNTKGNHLTYLEVTHVELLP